MVTEHEKEPVLELIEVSKIYGSGGTAIQALSSVSLRVEAGEFVSIVGPSGCGKTSLLNLIAGLEYPSSGHVIVEGLDLATINEGRRSEMRAKDVGYIFQSINLLPRLSVLDNVAWRLDDLGIRGRAARIRTRDMLSLVGVPEASWTRLPSELPGGEQQRVATARALIAEPKILLADEPTGNLDVSTSNTILDLLRRLNVERSMAVLLVTHDTYSSMYGHRTISMRAGRLVNEMGAPAPTPAEVLPFPAKPKGEGG